jgi:hypothetical protein
MNREQAPLRIKLYQSRTLVLYQHLLYGALVCYCVFAALATAQPALLLPVVWLAIAWVRWGRGMRNQAEEPVTIVWAPDGSWLVEHATGEPRHYPALNSCFNLHWLTILGFREGLLRQRYHLLLSDNCDPDLRRRLRVRLRQQVNPQAAKADNCRESAR